ncbi:hypothetical protein WUBG_10209 [Wuchereria bancrofti]|uniref:Uncharacterized protein n=1 Tax=Wuchereria bancrofti TaxID=6293 RepID=J9AWD4_WUCBA|nr:hypothetical protein WUBG_10209 [Wuchereria bancrofti]
MLKTSVYPGASPPRDAPSPTANDDPFREGVEIAFKHSLLVIFVFVYYVLMKTIAEMRGPQCGSSSLLPLPKLIPAKEESVVTPDSLQTDQSFRGSTHMLKMIEGIRANETLRTNSPSSVVSDPRLASSVVGCLSSAESTTTVSSSSFALLSQASSSNLLLSSGPPNQSQVSQIPPLQFVSSSSLSGVVPIQDMQTTLSNGNLPQWMHDLSSNFSASLPTAAPGSVVDVASISGTTNSLQTPIISSQLHGNQTANTAAVPSSILGSQSSSQNTIPHTTHPVMLPPPPPNVRPSLGVLPLNNFVPAAVSPYTVMSTTPAPSPATIPFPPGTFTVPPPRPLVVPPPNSLNIPPPSVMDCPPPGNFSLTTSSFASATPLVSCTFSSPSPSSSNSTTVASATGLVSRKPLTNGGNSNSIVDPAKVNGDLRHESRKQFENYGGTLDSRGDRRSFGGFCGSDGIGRGGLRDPRGRDRDHERNGNRGLQQQLHNNGGRRYSSDNRNRMLRYRDYDDDRRSRRYEPPHDDFNRNRR